MISLRGLIPHCIIGALPLLAVGIAASTGHTADPNPNPVDLGLLFVASLVLGCLMALVGIVGTHLRSRHRSPTEAHDAHETLNA